MFSTIIAITLFIRWCFDPQNVYWLMASGLFTIAGQIAMLTTRFDKLNKIKEKENGRSEENVQV